MLSFVFKRETNTFVSQFAPKIWFTSPQPYYTTQMWPLRVTNCNNENFLLQLFLFKMAWQGQKMVI